MGDAKACECGDAGTLLADAVSEPSRSSECACGENELVLLRCSAFRGENANSFPLPCPGGGVTEWWPLKLGGLDPSVCTVVARKGASTRGTSLGEESATTLLLMVD